jgi:hypothetical protein
MFDLRELRLPGSICALENSCNCRPEAGLLEALLMAHRAGADHAQSKRRPAVAGRTRFKFAPDRPICRVSGTMHWR